MRDMRFPTTALTNVGQVLSGAKSRTTPVCAPLKVGKSTIDDQIALGNEFPCHMCGKRESSQRSLDAHQRTCKKRKRSYYGQIEESGSDIPLDTDSGADIPEYRLCKILNIRGTGGANAEGMRFIQVVWGDPDTDTEYVPDGLGDGTADFN